MEMEFQSSDDEGKIDFSAFDKNETISEIDQSDITTDVTKEEDKKYPSFGDVQRKKLRIGYRL